MIDSVPFSKSAAAKHQRQQRRTAQAGMYRKSLELAKRLRDAKRELRRLRAGSSIDQIRVDVNDLISKVQATIDEAMFNGKDPYDALDNMIIPIQGKEPSTVTMSQINRLLNETDEAWRRPEVNAHQSVETAVQAAERQAANRLAFEQQQAAERQAANRLAFEQHQAVGLQAAHRLAFEQQQAAERQAANRLAFEQHQAALLESEVLTAYAGANAATGPGAYVAAVRRYREITGSGLREALDYVKALGLG